MASRTGDCVFLLAVNVYRPFTQTPEEIISLMESLQTRARLPVTGFINNANMLDLTEAGNLLHGESILSKVAEMTGKPILYHCGVAGIVESLRGRLSGEPLLLTPRNSPQWLRSGSIPY